MTDRDLPEGLVPRERHWAPRSDFLAATAALTFCAGLIVWAVLR